MQEIIPSHSNQLKPYPKYFSSVTTLLLPTVCFNLLCLFREHYLAQGYCDLSIAELALRFSVSESTIEKAISLLTNRLMIQTKRRGDGQTALRKITLYGMSEIEGTTEQVFTDLNPYILYIDLFQEGNKILKEPQKQPEPENAPQTPFQKLEKLGINPELIIKIFDNFRKSRIGTDRSNKILFKFSKIFTQKLIINPLAYLKTCIKNEQSQLAKLCRYFSDKKGLTFNPYNLTGEYEYEF